MKPVASFWQGMGCLVLFAAVSASAGEMGGAPSTVTIDHFAFKPAVITVTAGTEVNWVNRDSFSHSVVIGETESRRLLTRSQFKHVFNAPGEYTYHCGVHSSMQGKVIVTGSAGSAVTDIEAVEVDALTEAVGVSTSTEAGTVEVSTPDAGTGMPESPAVPVGEGRVSISDQMRFEPATLTVAPGTEVTWHNNDGSNHIIAFADQRSPRLRHGASYRRQFDQSGEYAYECAIHGQRMSGKIVVQQE